MTEQENEKGILLTLKVAPSDIGKVIGKQGKVANAIRSVVKAAGIRKGVHVMVDIE